MANFKTIDGVDFRVVTDREAKVGDYILYEESPGYYVKENKAYEVIDVDLYDDAQIVDEDEDEYDTCGDDFIILEKVDDIITHEGVTYRKVARKAKEGEKILVTAAESTSGYYKNGDVLTVREIGSYSGEVYVTEHSRIIYHSEYVVLEPIPLSIDDEIAAAKAAQEAASTKVAELEAKKKEITEANRLKVGDYAVATTGNNVGEFVGAVVEIIEDDGSSTPFKARVIGDSYSTWYYASSLRRADDEEVAKANRLKVGDYAKVVGGNNIMTKIGDIVEITSIETDGDYRVKKLSGEAIDGWKFPENVVRATDEEVAEAKRQLAFAQFAKGDKVRLVSGGGEWPLFGMVNGKIYTVDEVGVRKISVGCGYADPDQLVKLTAEEIAECAKREEETAKWAAIGRKVGEYKAGDVVRVIKVPGGICNGHDEGMVGVVIFDTIVQSLINGNPQITHNGETLYCNVELIAPVESVVNLRAS
ncbi:hypothetical protein [Brevibacillus daliensis]|uniref:hypothetical protein n=1 Tax=Brevibacillus daliensis TaxID=2892995 RepID=UPI001E431714|nr:hypothetical protein [Brevibacillus daliensis]